MYLSKLEIFGFKSFATKTVFEFSEGLTGIVGPNGCGKSNIVDAIRWVLGEQKVSTLRSDKMENVIFNGTSKRKPLGMAEVSLTIQNNKNILPTEFTEVVITRRLYRSGESQYLLNGQEVRLKDIQNLFMDTGMSPDAYSIIELKMIEMILSDNKEERRRLFEEAAGIKKYKLHRRVALRKLEQTQSELSRVMDLLSEVQRNVNSLSRQVAKTKRYLALKEELRTKEIQYQLFKYFSFCDAKLPLEEEMTELRATREKCSSKINVLESELEKIKFSALQLENNFQSIQRELNQIREKIDSLEKQNLVQEQQTEHLSSELNRLEQEYEMIKNRLAELEGVIATSREALEEKELEFTHLSSQVEAMQDEVEELQRSVSQKKELLSSLEHTYRQSQAKNEKQRRELEQTTILLATKMDEYDRITNAIIAINNEIDEKKKKIEDNLNNQKEVEQQIQLLQKEIEQLESARTKAENFLDSVQSEIIRMEKELSVKQNEIAIYENLIRNYEGYSTAVKEIMQSLSQEFTAIEPLLDIFHINEEYQKDFQPLLNDLMDVLLLSNEQDLDGILEKSKSVKKGQVGLLLPGWNDHSLPLPDENCIPMHTLIHTDGTYGSLLQNAFKSIFYTPSLETAKRLYQQYPYCIFVFPGGYIGGILSILKTGNTSDKELSVLGRKQHIETLYKETAGLSEKLQQFRHQADQWKSHRNEILQSLERLSLEKHLLSNKYEELKQLLAQFSALTQSLEKQLTENQERLVRLKDEIVQLQQKESQLKPLVEKELSSEDEILEKLETVKKEIQGEEFSLNRILSEYNNKRLDTVKLENEINQLKKEIFTAEKEMQTLTSRKEKIEGTDRQDLEETIHQLNKAIQQRNDELKKIYANYAEKEKIRDEIEQEYQNTKNLLLLKEEEIAQERRRFYHAQERIREIEMKMQELDLKCQSIGEQLIEFYQFDISRDLEQFDFDSQHFNPEETHHQILDLKNKIEKIGEVNPLAVEEYEKEKERLDFLMGQKNDIMQAQDELLQTIRELNRNATEKFQETFAAIRLNFIKVFKEFFPQGEADLELVDPSDLLESDINIRVTPKGRKLQTLTLMSAGEKTLTAISLLFAIYLVKPAPFCILDEVDAPLDDVNIGRFTQALKGFSKETQFIIVTHNKKTMEAMDAIYGVTMEEEGVSKIVSVQFK